MDWRRAALAAGGGAMAFALIFLACAYVFLSTVSFIPLGGGGSRRTGNSRPCTP